MAVAALITLWAISGVSFAQTRADNPQLAQVLADWRGRQELFTTVRYEITGTLEFKDDVLPPGDPNRPQRIVLLLDFERNRYRYESFAEAITETPGGGRAFVPRVGTETFDGKETRDLTHRDINRIPDGPDLTIGKGDDPLARFTSCLLPVFYGHGMVSTVHGPLRPDKLPKSYDPEEFEVRGRQVLGGRICAVVRTEPIGSRRPQFDELWIRSDLQSAVCRHVIFGGSEPLVVTDVTWKQFNFGWWPDQWTQTWNLRGKAWRIDRLKIKSIEPNPAVQDSDFTLQALPGMQVLTSESPQAGSNFDPRYPAQRTYRITPSGSWQEASAKGYTTLEGVTLPPSRSWAWLWPAGACLVFVAVITVLYKRFWRSGTVSPG